MRKILLILTVITLISCDNKTDNKNNSLIGMEFQNFNQIKQLENYVKVSDTSIIGNRGTNFESEYGILHLQDKLNNLIIFKNITLDSIRNRTYKVIDTLIIPNSKKSEYITIGYCDIDYGNNENIIALVDKTDSLRIQNIKKVWKGNTDTERIERVNDFSKYGCYNEFYADN